MNFFLSEIIGSSFQKLGCKKNFIRTRRQLSSCSTQKVLYQRIISKFDPMIASPVCNLSFGQPTHVTHPHKILEGEIVPGLREEEFKARRRRLVEHIEIFSSKNDFVKKSHLIIIPSSVKKYMTEKIPYVFRQNSDFLYLTGCLEPDSILVITSFGNEKQENILFLRGKDPDSELWDGPRTGIDQAIDFFGVDKSFPLIGFESFITSFIKQHSDCILWYDYMNDVHPSINKCLKKFLSQSWNKVWESPKPFIHRLRLYKSPAEQELMKKSCEIASKAIETTIKNSKPNDNESQIFARVDFECRMNGAEYLAYPPVVAGGNRANIIHYINNDQIVEDGNLVLMDAGCEFHGYCSDISRTWPISGKFSPVQRVLYEVVYSVQTDLIQICSKFPSLDHLFNIMCKLIGARLKDAGIISKKYSDIDLSRAAYSFCPHHVSHYLGMDVHDTSTVPRNISLEPNMILTIEPGIYVNLNNKLANPEFRGHGIRIEDDVLMTNNGPLVLSSCSKHPDDIEKLMNTKG